MLCDVSRVPIFGIYIFHISVCASTAKMTQIQEPELTSSGILHNIFSVKKCFKVYLELQQKMLPFR